MKFRARKTFKLGPLRFNFNQRGFSSWGIKLGPWTWNITRGSHSVNTPGWGGFTTSGRRRRRGNGGSA